MIDCLTKELFNPKMTVPFGTYKRTCDDCVWDKDHDVFTCKKCCTSSDGVNCEGPKDKEAKLATENCQKMEKWGLLQFDNAWKVKNVNDGGEPKLVCEVLHWPEDDQLMTGC